MADLTFIVEVILSIAAVTVPVGLILVLLVAGDYAVTDLFMAPSWDDRGAVSAPVAEEATPRWRLERLRPRGQGAGPMGQVNREDACGVPSAARTITFERPDR